MNGKEPFYITTAIAYVNGPPHLGHAYEAIMTDVMARFKRLDGHPVFFLTGTDEHGEKVATTAAKNEMETKAFCDKIAATFVEMTEQLNISNDDFIRTTEERHYKASQDIWQRMQKKGDIYLGQYEGWYSVREEAFFSEDELVHDPETNQKLTPNGTPVEWKEESSYFFKLSEYTEKLLEYYEANPEFIAPETRRNEVTSFVKQGLHDLSISRTTFDWGVPVPDDPDHVMYVWVDALTNYLTATGYPDTEAEKYKTFWPCDIHVVGKDITRFHAIYWPAFLMSADLPLPKQVFAHGFINVGGQKMSKSVGNVVAPQDLLDAFGVDGTRYLLTREIAHGQDGNFSHEHAVQRINADLANGLGNLAQRTLSMIAKNCDGQVPEHGKFTSEDLNRFKTVHETLLPSVQSEFEKFYIHRALEDIMKATDEANAYIDHQAPWTLRKTDTERMKTVLYVLAETIRCLAILMQPVTPDAAAKLLDQLSIPKDARDFSCLTMEHALKPGTSVPAPEGVFPRIIEEEAA